MRILICEDDPSRSDALGASVAIACPGAEVQRAVPGTSVARAVAETAPALAVVGPGLADGDGGGELVRVLCAEHPELAVLVVSTHDLAAPAVAALRAGAADYVVLGHGDDLAPLGRAAARRSRHALPRRGRGPRARAPGEAPARRAGPRGAAARRLQRAAVRRPHRRRLEPRPLAHGRGGPVPPRSLLSAARVRDHAPAASTAARRPPGAHRALHRALQPRAGRDLRAPAARRAPPAPRAPLARQRARARERARVAPRPCRRGGRGAGRAARAARDARGRPGGRRARPHRARAR